MEAVFKIKGRAPTSSPIILKFNYDRNRESRKNNPRYWSMLARKRQKEYPC